MKIVKKNTAVVVKHILGETAENLVTRLDNGKYVFNCDAYVSGQACNGGFYHLRQAKELIPGKKLGSNNVKFWPRLRKALHIAGLTPVNIPGGKCPIHYFDELVVPDYSVSGSHYFVIKRSDIGKYLDMLPLDEAGKEHAKSIEKQNAEAQDKIYRKNHDPKCIAKRIGDDLYLSAVESTGGEFVKITLVPDGNGKEFSVIYPTCSTDLIWPGSYNVPKVICESSETGIKYLSGYTAGHLDPSKHWRIMKTHSNGWNRNVAYLMPNSHLATEVRKSSRWMDLFDSPDNDGIPAWRIASAQKVILETYDLYDRLLKERYVYDSASKRVIKEYLQNWPFNFNNDLIGTPDWRAKE